MTKGFVGQTHAQHVRDLNRPSSSGVDHPIGCDGAFVRDHLDDLATFAFDLGYPSKGIDLNTLREKTGISDNNLRASLYRMKKKGVIKSAERGVYARS